MDVYRDSSDGARPLTTSAVHVKRSSRCPRGTSVIEMSSLSAVLLFSPLRQGGRPSMWVFGSRLQRPIVKDSRRNRPSTAVTPSPPCLVCLSSGSEHGRTERRHGTGWCLEGRSRVLGRCVPASCWCASLDSPGQNSLFSREAIAEARSQRHTTQRLCRPCSFGRSTMRAVRLGSRVSDSIPRETVVEDGREATKQGERIVPSSDHAWRRLVADNGQSASRYMDATKMCRSEFLAGFVAAQDGGATRVGGCLVNCSDPHDR